MNPAENTVGLFDAKTHLSALIERVERGEEITITRRGTPIARLVPARPSIDSAKAVTRIRSLRKGVSLGRHRLRDLIEEGRS